MSSLVLLVVMLLFMPLQLLIEIIPFQLVLLGLLEMLVM